jgi:hypothetical protein
VQYILFVIVLNRLALVEEMAFNDSNRVAPEEESVPATSADITLGVIPPASEQLKNSNGQRVMKLCGETDWQLRRVIVTSSTFIITHPGDSEISDQIPLVSGYIP